MDNSTNGGTDKRNWREKLGIGTNGQSKPADGAKTVGEAASPKVTVAPEAKPAPGAAKVAPRPQTVARPAPMAPRAPTARPGTATIAARPAAPPAAAPAERPATSAPPSVAAVAPPKVTLAPPPRPVPAAPAAPVGATSPEGLANRLKAQREAAEKLAEQRIQMARQRAEAARQDAAAVTSQSRPKFSFVDDESKAKTVPSAQTNLPPPLVRTAPPRPTLGGEGVRPAIPQQRPAGEYQPPPPPSYAPRHADYAPPYRPVDPVTGYAPQPGGNRNYVPPLAQQRPSVAPPPEGQGPDFGYAPPVRQVRPPRPGQQPLAPRPAPQIYAEGDDIFEQPVRRSRRPTANEYAQAYQENAGAYDELQEREGGPWWILVGALVLIAAAVGGYLFYSNYLQKQVATQPTTTTPVVTAPEQPAKVQPEQPVSSGQATQQPSVDPATAKPTKKQIYDRIVGDREVLGDAQLVPTEEIPVQPEAGTEAVVPAGQVAPGAAPPAGGVDQGAGDTAPLPVPPPPGNTGQQGQIEDPPKQTPTEIANIAPAANESEAANLPVDGLKATTAVAVDDVVPTPTDKLAAINGSAATPTVDQVPQVPGASTTSATITPVQPAAPTAPETGTQVAAAAPAATVGLAEAPAEAAPPTPTVSDASKEKPAEAIVDENDAAQGVTETSQAPVKAATKAKKKASTQKTLNDLGARPVVLVPPGGGAASPATQASDGLYGVLPADVQPGAPATTAPASKKRTLSDLFKQRQTEAVAPAETTAARPQQQQTRQIAAVQPQQTAPAVTRPAPSGNGYVVQLSSFRSRAEADQEFGRVRSKYANIISSLSPLVTESNIGGSTRYRLGLGPLDSRATASQVCSRLISAGERDCSVSRQ